MASDKVSAQQCLALMRNAKSDNEKFASLMVVTKALKAEECDNELKMELIEAIGFSFLDRLLKTDKAPDGCPGSIFPALALSVLSAFSHDQHVVSHPEYVKKIPDFCRVISTKRIDDEDDPVSREMVDDSYECLHGLARASVASITQQLVISTLSECFQEKLYGCEKAFSLLIYVVEKFGSHTWVTNSATLQSLVSSLAEDFHTLQTSEKFELCTQLCQIVPIVPKDSPGIGTRTLVKAVREILQSKIGKDQREPTLHLVAAIISSQGLKSFLPPNTEDCKSFLLIVQLVAIEVRMAMEEEDFEKVSSKEALLSSCFSILEPTITYLTEGEALSLNSKQTGQVHNALVGAFNAILFFLSHVDKNHPDKMLELVVIGSVRVLGSWLAEETAALRKEVYEILPFLINISQATFPVTSPDSVKTDQVCVLQFLLPGLCHLTAEDESRAILLSHQIHILLAQYFSYLWTQFTAQQQQQQTEISLRTLSGVLLNLCVLETQLMKSHPAFTELFSLIIEILPHLLKDSSHLVLLANLITMGLMIGRHPEIKQVISDQKLKQFFCSVIKFLSQVHTCTLEDQDSAPTLTLQRQFKCVWEDVAELWFLAIQALGSSVCVHPELSQILLTSDWFPVLVKQLLATQVSRENNVVTEETHDVYMTLLCEFAQDHPEVKQLIINSGALSCTVR